MQLFKQQRSEKSFGVQHGRKNDKAGEGCGEGQDSASLVVAREAKLNPSELIHPGACLHSDTKGYQSMKPVETRKKNCIWKDWVQMFNLKLRRKTVLFS